MPFVLNDNYHARVSRYRRRERSGPIGCAIDLTVTPTFPGLAAPAAPTATPSASGGTLAAGTQTYAVSAINVNGETTPSAQASATTTGTTSSVSLRARRLDRGAQLQHLQARRERSAAARCGGHVADVRR